MPAKKRSFFDVKNSVSANKLRQYPGIKKGYDRLFPYAKPKIKSETRIPYDGTFFVIGNCFARSIEKSLNRAERRYLSSPTDLGLPGSAMEQFGRYNIYNLDVSTNEIDWARDPSNNAVNDALIEVEGEWVDMQIHWTFAHGKQDAETYRKIYNTSYAGVYNADTVIVSVSGIEQWFDRKTGLYLNIMPSRRMTDDAPDRFELHRLDVDACAASLRRFCDLVLEHSTKDPLILVTVSPVSQPSVHGDDDALVDQFLAKATQRAAADMVCAEYDRVEYLPFLEMAMLSDFKFGYRENSPNHTSQALANRGVAHMLETYEGPSGGATLLAAIGHTEAQLIALDFEAAVVAAEKATNFDLRNDELDMLYTRALRGVSKNFEAMTYLLDRLVEGVVTDPDRHIREVLNMLKNTGDKHQIERLLVYLMDWDIDQKQYELLFDAMFEARQKASTIAGAHAQEIAALKKMAREGEHRAIVEQAKTMLDNADDPLALQDRETVLLLMTQSMAKQGHHADIFLPLTNYVTDSEKPSIRLTTMLLNYAKSHADVATLETIINLKDKIGDALQWGILETRFQRLQADLSRDIQPAWQ
ncbi:GSCFA domain-containing protein [Loktanella sp. SALINAS62]|uniref:GSCFA domain-containing protein n=1 Tax=Loktanella sp. SALINAS62 TaxID=2706124 RepID=UPI001B8CEFA1|nr:GSCFA domain-containing protein [Loktanella sp. SALINAS62]MBS1301531.1 GSCFA domain-containing protein [Loktanella sp. SALINAS62]